MKNKIIIAENHSHNKKKKGKSRQEICHDLGFNYYTFSDWMIGRKYPRMDKVEMLADYFGIKKSDLIEEHVIREQHDTNSEIVEVIFKLRTSPELLKLCTILKDLDKEQITSITAMIQQLYGKNQ